MKGKYIYGIIKNNGKRNSFAVEDIGSNGEVLVLGYKELGALVSTAQLQTYETLSKEETIKDLVLHQKVIEDVMKEAVILPVKFGTMMEEDGEVIEVIVQGYPLLQATLERMEGKLEIDVVATWKIGEEIKEIYTENKKIQKQQERVTRNKEGDTLDEKIFLGEMVAEELARRKDKYAKAIITNLEKFAADICIHELFTDEVVFNSAFLLERTKQKAFEKEVDKLDKKLAGRLDFRLVGPLPPYSFATVVVRRFGQEEVEQAKEALGLNGNLSLQRVKKAYHELARRLHPDKGSNYLEFSAIAVAYKKLREFCQNGWLSVEIMKWEGKR